MNKYLLLLFLLIIKAEISQLTYDENKLTDDSSTFSIASDSYCFCDLTINVADSQCCCDTLVTNKTNCLLGSVKKSCIKKYILAKQNIDQCKNSNYFKGVQVEESDTHTCFIYEKSNAQSSSVILPETFTNTQYLQDYLKYNIYTDTIPMKKDQTQLQIYQVADDSNIIYFRDSNGICKKQKRLIKYKQIEKRNCLMIECLTTSPSISVSNTIQSFQQSGNIYATATVPTGCVSGQSTAMAYSTLSTIATSFSANINNFYITATTSAYTFFSEILYMFTSTNSNFQGQVGYTFGQYVQGFIGTTTNARGFRVYNGKISQSDSTCSTISSISTIINPVNYEPLKFGNNIQFSCSYDLNTTTAGTIDWTTFDIFKSFQTASTIGLARTPLYSLTQSDFIVASETTPTAGFIPLTQQVLIYTDQFGIDGQRQNYISSVKILYPKTILKTNVASSTTTYRFNVKIRFINLAIDEIENSLPQDPPFIPQLPSDIFFPIWYETYGPLISGMILLQLFW